MEEEVEKLIFLAVSAVLLLLGMLLLVTFFRSLDPQQQTALANAEKLRAAIEEACFRNVGADNPVHVSVNIPQAVPLGSSVITVLPRWLIHGSGDPNNVLYYETFPPGEAIGWESYHNFNGRLVILLDDSFEDATITEVKAKILEVKRNYETANPGASVEELFVSNVILDETFDAKTRRSDPFGERSGDVIGGEENDASKKITGLGSWEEGTSALGAGVFEFTNYLSLNPIDKTTIKYYACGDNTLCLKTRDGIHRFPLEHCGDIDYVQLVYNPADTGENAKGFFLGLGGILGGGFLVFNVEIPGSTPVGLAAMGFGATEISKTVLYWTASWKVSDFYMASPCEQDFEITIESCSAQGAADSHAACVRPIKYPIYHFEGGTADGDTEGGKLKRVGYHTACVDSVMGDVENKPPESSFDGDVNRCIKIKTEKIVESSTLQGTGDFCWTFNPYVERDADSLLRKVWAQSAFVLISGPLIPAFTNYGSLKEFTAGAGGMPVTFNADYDLQKNIFILQPSAQAPSGSGIKRFLLWGWP